MATDYRAELVRLMRETLADEAANHTWFYRATRPMHVPSVWAPHQTVTGDCSKGVQFLCKWAGCNDPMGSMFGPYGNSQTLWSHLQHVDTPSELLPGDIVTFGFDGNEHAAMVLEAGTDPLLWSFGHQGAPNSYRLSGDRRSHQYLRNPLPLYVPTGKDRLRAKTGWFSWVSWRLGEGDWRPYGHMNKSVRPDVPRFVPPGWWKRYARFIFNRKQGNEPTS